MDDKQPIEIDLTTKVVIGVLIFLVVLMIFSKIAPYWNYLDIWKLCSIINS